MRQHSVRVAEYTQILFDGVCKSSFYTRHHETPIYMDTSYAEIAYKCGFYHQIGKAYDPDIYPIWRDDFTIEEKQEYCRYTIEGRNLVAKLQGERGSDISTPNRMIQEACAQHMERWDGSGFPNGYYQEQISLIAQIVGLAKELDRLVCERKSESPFEEAVDLLIAEEDKMFSSKLMDVFRTCQTDLRNVYKKYIQYTKIMPKTVPLVEKRPERPFGLKYRQIVHGEDAATFIFEAVPWFGGVLEQPAARESGADVEEMLMRADMINDISTYFLYEAADALVRMKNCELYTSGVLVPMFSEFFRGESQIQCFDKLFEDTGVDRKKLMLMVSEKLLHEDHSIRLRLAEYIEQGIVLVLDDYYPEDLPIELIREIGFTHVRIAQDSIAWNEIEDTIEELESHGIVIIDWPSGDTQVTEDELIRYMMRYE